MKNEDTSNENGDRHIPSPDLIFLLFFYTRLLLENSFTHSSSFTELDIGVRQRPGPKGVTASDVTYIDCTG
jgi:hypothetical protein